MISVCMITYNGAKYLEAQLRSILKQLNLDDELIISDDGSTDSTIEIINSFNDSRIKLFVNNYFKNPTLNMQNALKMAKGDFIFMSDQDDVWVENKVSIMKAALEKDFYVVSDCFITDSNLNIISETRYTKEANIKKNKILALFFPTPYQGSCAAFRKEILSKALPFPIGIQSHDRWIGNVAAFYYSVKFIPEKLIFYRRHSENVSTATTGKSPNRLMKRIRYRVGYIKALLQRF